MDLRLAGKVAAVAGASRGIGRAIADCLSAEGCSVALIARGAGDLGDAASAIVNSSAHVADVASAGGATSAIESVVARWGRLDIVVCNAGSGASVPPGQEDEVEWRRVLDVNLFTAINVIAAARPHLAAGRGDRAIVCVSSIAGLAALGAPVAYSAAKAALNSVVRGLARPLAQEGIRINAVAPGNIMVPGGRWEQRLTADPTGVGTILDREVALRRFGTPAEIADLVAVLASPRSAFITGTVVVADGGQLRS